MTCVKKTSNPSEKTEKFSHTLALKFTKWEVTQIFLRHHFLSALALISSSNIYLPIIIRKSAFLRHLYPFAPKCTKSPFAINLMAGKPSNTGRPVPLLSWAKLHYFSFPLSTRLKLSIPHQKAPFWAIPRSQKHILFHKTVNGQQFFMIYWSPH